MKRDYKFFSVFIVLLISAITGGLIGGVFRRPMVESALVSVLVSLVLTIIGSIFQFTIDGGLLRDRMGSVSDYLNQVNYINFRVITVFFIVSVIRSIISGLLGGSGAMSLGIGLLNPTNSSVFTIGAFLLPLILFILSIIISLLFAYASLYLADNYDKDEPVGKSLKNILGIGRILFFKTLGLYAKYILIPCIIYIALMVFLLAGLDRGYMGISLFLILSFVFLIYVVIVMVVIIARKSDIYLDYKESLNK